MMWGWNGWGWWPMWLGMVLFWGALIWFGVWLLRRREPGSIEERPRDDPQTILRERFARGEIDEEELGRRTKILSR